MEINVMCKKNYRVDIVLVLGNLMSRNGELNEETTLRVDKAFEIFIDSQAGSIITCGWAYRTDTGLSIASAMRNYLVNKHGLDKKFILIQDKSRDTVGDAYFARVLYSDPMVYKSIAVVTSAYHVERVREIFNFIFSDSVKVNVIGVGSFESDMLESEKKSLDIFREMFRGVMPGDVVAIHRRLSEMHPYYNGSIYGKI